MGKSHIAISLAVSAIAAGHTVLHESTFDLVAQMAEAEATGGWSELVSELTSVDLLLLENLGAGRF